MKFARYCGEIFETSQDLGFTFKKQKRIIWYKRKEMATVVLCRNAKG